MSFRFSRSAMFSVLFAAVAAALAACGGGGGSAGGGGGGGGGGGPTPTPTPMVTQTPLQHGTTILPDTTGRISPIQVLDNKMSATQILAEAQYEDAVWGAFNPAAWVSGERPGTILSLYVLPPEDLQLASGNGLSWFQQNHPDWILYACDQNGTPTQWVSRAADFANVPLDFTNPAVQQYQAQLYMTYMAKNHYNTLAADNVEGINYMEAPNALVQGNAPGYPSNEQPGTDGWYGCGVYQGPGFTNFKKIFNGPYDQADPVFESAMLGWIKYMHTTLKANGYNLIVDHPIGTTSDPNEQTLVANIDGLLYEAGFADYDRYNTSIPNILSYMKYAQQQHVAFWIVDYFCTLSVGGCEASITSQQKDYGIATYELGNYGGAGVYLSASTGEIPSYLPEFATQVGTPCGDYSSNGTVFQRKFAGALVIASDTGGSVSLPTTHTYTDMEGRTVTNPLVLQPDDGYVLLTSNGCS